MLSKPYSVPVPRAAALTRTSLSLKSSLWPTVFAPRRKGNPEPWSPEKVRWAQDAMQIVLGNALQSSTKGEVSQFGLLVAATLK
jgi:tRNA-specific adenosine deaminase 3